MTGWLSGSGGKRGDPAEQWIRDEQVAMLYQGLWQPCLFSVIGAALLVGILWPVVAHGALLAWLLVMLLVSMVRCGIGVYFRRLDHAARRHPRWRCLALGGALLTGSVWGAAVIWLFPHEPAYQPALVLTVAGVSAGAVTTLSPLWTAAIVCLVPVALPMAFQYARMDTPLASKLALMVGVFLVFVIGASQRWSSVLREKLRLEADRQRREQDLRESEARYRAIFRASPLGVFHFDTRGRILDCNDRFVDLIGTSRAGLIGLDLPATLHDTRVQRALTQALTEGQGHFEGDYTAVLSGQTRPMRALFSGIRDGQGAIVGGMAIIEDLTEHRQAEATIHRQAFYDPLTNLPNRRLLLDRLARVQAHCRRHGEHGAVLFIDLDHFKKVNESLGHAAGDRLLMLVAERLGALQEGEGLTARVSGDGFVIVLASLGETLVRAKAGAQQMAERVVAALSASYPVAERTLTITPSLGVALFGAVPASSMELIKQAETAMYQAKAGGRACVRHYLPSMRTAALHHLALEQGLRQALASGEQLMLYFQPQVDRQARVIGAEALLRWQHPSLGMVSPAEFIPVAEETGLILELGDWVLREACEALRRLPASRLPRLSVNISPHQFARRDFVERVAARVEAAGIDPARLLLEITEGVLIDDLYAAVETLNGLKRIGVALAIDDFGVGYSSLSYLKRLPLDELKIDRSFIQELEDANDAAIVQTIIAIARHLALAVVAEGVETHEQQAFLEANGCHAFQGFLFHRPMPYAALASSLKAVAGATDSMPQG